MKRLNAILFPLLIIGATGINSCKKDNPDVDKPVLALKPDNVSGKSGFNVSSVLSGTVPNGVENFYISKTVNLQPDSTWGTNGTLKITDVAAGTTSLNYDFVYTLKDEEVDKLVGFNYRIEDSKGKAAEKDLTVNTIASGAQIIASHPWKIISVIWETDDPPSENIQDCAKDDTWTYRRDSTVGINYGASGCLFDGFNIFDKWTLSEDEKTFTRTYHSVFDATKVTTEVYTVKTLTKDKMVVEIGLDLSAFGLGDNELFEYTYVPN